MSAGASACPVPLQENMILAFNPKMIDVFAKANGEIIQVRFGAASALWSPPAHR